MRISMKHPTKLKRAAVTLAVCLPVGASLTGCGIGAVNGAGFVPTTIHGAALQGMVHGGQQPVQGALIQLYAATSAGYGQGATQLLTTTVTSDGGGNWSFTSGYTCPSATTPVYITATGGNPGSGTNANLTLMTALGQCGNLASLPFVYINEVTTVASVWALSPFMTGLASVSSGATNTTGLANAFADVNTLVDISVGTSPGPSLPAGTTVPSSEINTLANLLAPCINSAGGTENDGSACGTLFLKTVANGSYPSDTVTAAMNIAQHPTTNIATLYPLAVPASPFQPSLSGAPNDFTIAVNFTAGNLNAPSALAIDASGNVWIANSGGNTVTELNHAGAALSGTGYTASLNNPSAIAIDASGGPWIANKGGNSISRLTSSGGAVRNTPYTAGGNINAPVSIAFDFAGNAWILDAGSMPVNQQLVELDSSGNYLNSTVVSAPLAVAVNPH